MLRERVQSLLRTHGGRVTMKIVQREFSRELKGGGDITAAAGGSKAFQEMLMQVLKALTRRTQGADGEYWYHQAEQNKSTSAAAAAAVAAMGAAGPRGGPA